MTRRKKILILLVSLLVVHLGFIYAFRLVSKKKHELTIQLNTYKHAGKVKILFMGDSHTNRSIDVSQIDSSFTLGYYGENNMMNYYKLKYCLEHGYPCPEYAAFPCDIVTFSKGFYGLRSNKFFYYRFIPFSDVANLDDHALAMYYDYIKTRLVPYTEWQYAMNRVNMDRQRKANDRFSDKSVEERAKSVSHFIQDELLQQGDKANLFDAKALEYLQKTIDLCKVHHIKPIYLKFPISKAVFDEVREHVDSSYIHTRPSEKILQQASVPVLNFEYMFTEHPELFFDSHHLNLDGQKQFTPVLKRNLDSLMQVY